jgi:hypothetical protein
MRLVSFSCNGEEAADFPALVSGKEKQRFRPARSVLGRIFKPCQDSIKLAGAEAAPSQTTDDREQ